jgi:hypothetical protein
MNNSIAISFSQNVSRVGTGFPCRLMSIKLCRDYPVITVHSGDARIVPTVKSSGRRDITTVFGFTLYGRFYYGMWRNARVTCKHDDNIYIYMRANQRTLDSSRLSNKAIGLYCYTEDSTLSIFFVLDEVVCLN